MVSKLNLTEKLDFSDIDLTAPDMVINEILTQLPEETNGLVMGKIVSYNGPIMSYKKKGVSSIAASLSLGIGTEDIEVDIQEKLGKIGQETHKFECYLYTPEYEKYKYRVFFVKYDLSNYPATVVLDSSVAKSVSTSNTGYIYTCSSRSELENLIVNVLTSKRVVSVMQELIRVNQAKKAASATVTVADTEENDETE